MSTMVGKADFVVFSPSYVVIIDIIDIPDANTPKSYFEDFIREKINNQRTMLRFIRQISKGNQSGETSEASTLFKVFRYIAFPQRNICRRNCVEETVEETACTFSFFDIEETKASLPLLFPDQNKTGAEYFPLPFSFFEETECTSNEVVYNSLRK